MKQLPQNIRQQSQQRKETISSPQMTQNPGERLDESFRQGVKRPSTPATLPAANRATRPLRQAAMLRMQQTHGNACVRRQRLYSAALQRVPQTEDTLHQPLIDDYRRWRGLPPGGVDEFGNRIGPDDAQIKYGQRTDPPLGQAQIEARLLREITHPHWPQGTLLPTDIIETALNNRAQNAELTAVFNQAVQRIQQEQTFDLQMQQIELAPPPIIRLLETQFINNPTTSTLDLLTPAQRQRYRDFSWGEHDYPGGTAGGNESRARGMATALSGLRPERRVNQGSDAVVRQSEYNAAMRAYINAELRDIPDFPQTGQQAGQGPTQPAGERLNQHALADFLRMREAALQDGVAIIVRDSYRTPATAAANAASSGNPAAVASFSPHMLGLAVDLQMSFTSQNAAGVTTQHQFQETTTTPMQNVMDMRHSPTHKWLFLRGAAYGWYPYQNEPWHWEYNPPGFRVQFRQGMQP